MRTRTPSALTCCFGLVIAVAVAASLGLVSDPPAQENKPAAAAKPDPYPFNTCVVRAADELPSEPMIYVHEGRELRFCCGGCLSRFMTKPEDFLPKLNERVIESQLKDYPLETCVVMPEENLSGDEVVNYVHGNRLVRLCCNTCVRKFRRNPEPYMKVLDEAIIAKQLPAYPTTECIVGSGEVIESARASSVIIGNRLVRLCCRGCEPKLRAEPAKYLAKLDELIKAKAAPAPN